MKIFTWNLGKNIKLKIERGIRFENVMNAVIKGNYKIARIKSKIHKGQYCFIIRYMRKHWIVPFKEYKKKIHLYTIFERD